MTKIKNENFNIDVHNQTNTDSISSIGLDPIIDIKVTNYYAACKELLRDYKKEVDIKVVAGKGLFLGLSPNKAVEVFYEDQYTLEYDTLMVHFNKDYQGDKEGMVDRAIQQNLKPLQAVQLFYKENPIDLNLLVGIKSERKEFHEEVRNLENPYLNLSYSQFKHLKDQDFDYYMLGDSVVTFGDANGGYALIPVNEERKQELLSRN